MASPLGFPRLVLDVLLAGRSGPAAVTHRRLRRLEDLVAWARERSPYYARLYRDLPPGPTVLADLPVVTKPELMAAFDAWVTDPAVTLAGVRQFLSDPELVGSRHLGRYLVCSTSGTTGRPGIFLHDAGACAVYRALSYRLDLDWLSGRQWLRMLRLQGRWAAVVGTGGHFAGDAWMQDRRRRSGWHRRTTRVFSVQQPLEVVVRQLSAFRPAVLTGYPSVLALLAEERRAGRLRVAPVLVELVGESMDAAGRARIAAGFDGALREAYSASECLTMAFDCGEGWLHVNDDWCILEPVRADGSPAPAGEPSHTVLLTNLANRVQPIIRYDLGDSVVVRPDPCPCGSPFPAIRVAGRRDDVLRLRTRAGRTVALVPLAVGAVLSEVGGVHRSQVEQTGPTHLVLRIEVESGADSEQVWTRASKALDGYLRSQGLADVVVERDPEPPRVSVSGGKFRQVVALAGEAGR